MTTALPRNFGRVLTGLAIALAVGIAATPALADNGKHRGGHHGYYGPPGHHKHHHHGSVRYYPAPVYFHPPPPVYYVPRPVYYYPPPQPGLTLVFPLKFD